MDNENNPVDLHPDEKSAATENGIGMDENKEETKDESEEDTETPPDPVLTPVFKRKSAKQLRIEKRLTRGQ